MWGGDSYPPTTFDGAAALKVRSQITQSKFAFFPTTGGACSRRVVSLVPRSKWVQLPGIFLSDWASHPGQTPHSQPWKGDEL